MNESEFTVNGETFKLTNKEMARVRQACPEHMPLEEFILQMLCAGAKALVPRAEVAERPPAKPKRRKVTLSFTEQEFADLEAVAESHDYRHWEMIKSLLKFWVKAHHTGSACAWPPSFGTASEREEYTISPDDGLILHGGSIKELGKSLFDRFTGFKDLDLKFRAAALTGQPFKAARSDGIVTTWSVYPIFAFGTKEIAAYRVILTSKTA